MLRQFRGRRQSRCDAAAAGASVVLHDDRCTQNLHRCSRLQRDGDLLELQHQCNVQQLQVYHVSHGTIICLSS